MVNIVCIKKNTFRNMWEHKVWLIDTLDLLIEYSSALELVDVVSGIDFHIIFRTVLKTILQIPILCSIWVKPYGFPFTIDLVSW